MKKTKAYPIFPAAPVMVTLIGVAVRVLALKCLPNKFNLYIFKDFDGKRIIKLW
jgi:hypothetical protein